MFFEMPQEDSFSSQTADYKSETQLKTRLPHRHSPKTSPRPRVKFIYLRNTQTHVLHKTSS